MLLVMVGWIHPSVTTLSSYELSKIPLENSPGATRRRQRILAARMLSEARASVHGFRTCSKIMRKAAPRSDPRPLLASQLPEFDRIRPLLTQFCRHRAEFGPSFPDLPHHRPNLASAGRRPTSGVKLFLGAMFAISWSNFRICVSRPKLRRAFPRPLRERAIAASTTLHRDLLSHVFVNLRLTNAHKFRSITANLSPSSLVAGRTHGRTVGPSRDWALRSSVGRSTHPHPRPSETECAPRAPRCPAARACSRCASPPPCKPP